MAGAYVGIVGMIGGLAPRPSSSADDPYDSIEITSWGSGGVTNGDDHMYLALGGTILYSGNSENFVQVSSSTVSNLPQGMYLAPDTVYTPSQSGTVVLWSTAAFTAYVTIYVVAPDLSSVSLSPSELTLAPGGTGSSVARLDPAMAEAVLAVSGLPDGISANLRMTGTGVWRVDVSVGEDVAEGTYSAWVYDTGTAIGATLSIVVSQDGDGGEGGDTEEPDDTVYVTRVTISASPYSGSLTWGSSAVIRAYVTPSDATDPELDMYLTSGSSVATRVGSWTSGRYTYLELSFQGIGSFTVRADAMDGSGATASRTFEVGYPDFRVPVESIEIEGPEEIVVQGTGDFSAIISPDDATEQEVYWSVDDEEVAEVQSPISGDTARACRLLGLQVGTVTLRALAADSSGVYAEVSVRVVDPSEEYDGVGLSIDGPSSALAGSSAQYTATASPSSASVSLVWSIESGDATVDSSGLVTFGSVGRVVVSVTDSVSGASASMTVTVREEDGSVDFVLDANGGAFPDGSEIVYVNAPDGRYTLPDWSVVDRPGYRLSGWTGSSSGSASMGSEQTTAETWTAVWASDPRSYDTTHLPHASIRIYRALDEYIDATYLQIQGGQAVVSIAEDETGSASFTLVSDYRTAGRGLMASDCSLWSSGSPGPIRPGMYVRIDDIQSDGTVSYVFDGFITTITPDAETVAIECGDRMTFLAKQGTTLRRNYYGGERDSMLVSAGNDGYLYGDLSELPDGAVVDGTIYWTILKDLAYESERDIDTQCDDDGLQWTWEWNCELDYITALHLNYMAPSWQDRTWTIRMTSGDRTVRWTHTDELDMVNRDKNRRLNLTISNPLRVVDGRVTVTCHSSQAGNEDRMDLYVSKDLDGTISYRATIGSSVSNSVRDVTYSGGPADRLGRSVVEGYTLAGTEGAVSGTKYYPTSIEGDTTDESLYTPSAHRVYVPYVVSGTQSTVDVMEGVSWALGMMALANTDALARDETMVAIFRTGGGYAMDYLQKLADIASSEGRMRTFICRGYTTPVLAIGARYERSDDAQDHIHYGGDSVSGGTPYSAFSPSYTLKNRPSLVTLRGTISEQGSEDSVPLQIAMEDSGSTEARYGVLVETVVADSSVSSMGDAGQAVWSELASSDLDELEGTVTVPGVRRDLMDVSGAHAGSGVPVSLTDTRRGLSAYRARVRQLYIDYNACTTRATITNYSMVYSSGLDDTTVLAITATDVSTGANSTTLFNSQYVRVKTAEDQALGDGTQVTMYGIKSDGTTFQFDSVSVFALPTGRHVVHGVAYQDNSGHCEDSQTYGVVAVRIGSQAQLDIRASLRPDYYRGQTLSVDVDCP